MERGSSGGVPTAGGSMFKHLKEHQGLLATAVGALVALAVVEATYSRWPVREKNLT